MNRELILSYFEEYMEAGTYFLHLNEICSYLKTNPKFGGLMLESFATGLNQFLAFYQYQILNLKEAVLERRIKENSLFGESMESLKSRPITLLELKIHLEPLITQIQLIAFIVIKPYDAIEEYDKKMLANQEREINGDIEDEDNIEIEKTSKRNKYWSKIAEMLPAYQGNYLVINQIIPVFAKEAWIQEFPKGSNLLSYLYNILVSLESDLSVIDMVRSLFQRTLRPYLNFITSFIFEGEFEDPFGEFYIEKILQESPDDMEVDMNEKYKITEKQKFRIKSNQSFGIPIFLSRFAVQIFK